MKNLRIASLAIALPLLISSLSVVEAQESKPLSIGDTVEYMNKLVDSGLMDWYDLHGSERGQHGKFFVNQKTRTIWYSFAKHQVDSPRWEIVFTGLTTKNADPDSVEFRPHCSSTNGLACVGVGRKKWADGPIWDIRSQRDLKKIDIDIYDKYQEPPTSTSGIETGTDTRTEPWGFATARDIEGCGRLARALKHLILEIQKLPQDPNDPFAQ